MLRPNSKESEHLESPINQSESLVDLQLKDPSRKEHFPTSYPTQNSQQNGRISPLQIPQKSDSILDKRNERISTSDYITNSKVPSGKSETNLISGESQNSLLTFSASQNLIDKSNFTPPETRAKE